MPKFQVELDSGKKYIVEADTQPTPEEVTSYINQQQGGSGVDDAELGIEQGQLTMQERLSGGFRSPQELESRRASQRVALGLAQDAPLEPTPDSAGLFENLKDVPADIIDCIAPAFPAIGNILGGLSGTVTGAAAGGIGAVPGGIAGAGAGAAIGEFARQFVGENAFGFDQGTIGERAGKIALEGGLGAAFQGAGIGVNAAIRATKMGLIKTANKLLTKKGIDGFVKIFGKLAPNIDYMQTQYALDAMRAGDYAVMNENLAKPEFARKFAKRLLFGKNGDLAQNISNLSKTRPGADKAMKLLFGESGPLKLPDEVVETIINKGAKGLAQFKDPAFILKFGDDIAETVTNSIDDVGSQLAKARINLAKEATGQGATIDLEALNTGLAQHLEQVGFLKKVANGYSINKDFAVTSTGKQQAGIFSDLVERFFSKASTSRAALAEEANKGSIAAIQELANRASAGGRAAKEFIFSPKSSMHYGEFVKKLSNIDVQISGNEFKTMGKLAPDLTIYLRGLRQFPKDIATKMGNTSVVSLTDEFYHLTEALKPIRELAHTKDKLGMERFLKGLTASNASEARKAIGENIDKELSKKGINLLDSLKRFKASQVIKDYDNPLVRGTVEDGLIGTMKNVFKEKGGMLSAIEESIDPHLPKGYQIVKTSRDHVVSENLHNSAISILRSRFLGNAAIQPILGPAVGAAAGALLGGPVGAGIGATATLAGGMALSNPALFRGLLKVASKEAGRQILQTPAKQIPQLGYLGAQQLLKGLLGQQAQNNTDNQ